MHRDLVSSAGAHAALAFALGLGMLAGPLAAQTTCQCTTVQPFGSCVEKRAQYPDLFPGSCVLVPPVPGKPAFLFVADLFGGLTYRYDALRFDTATPVKIPSPNGFNATTGIAYRQVGSEVTLFWAVEGRIYSTATDGTGARALGTVPMDQLAELVRTATGDPSIVTGELGGITNHASRATLWGVDIVNDLYFELRETGELLLEDGKPRFFFNPLRNKISGGAYGNTIAFAESGGKEYFDIPVGTLTDRRPSTVVRVHASPGVAPETHKVGDPTGISYPLGTGLGTPKFVTGIAFWPSSCGAAQSSHFLLEYDPEGGAPRIQQVAADEPAAAAVASFSCAETGPATVTLTWRKTRKYDSLKITRQLVSKAGSPLITLFQGADFAADPERFVDASAIDGTYEYVATTTTGSQSLPASCRIVVGVGSVAAHRRFQGKGDGAVPYAIAVADSARVIVADLHRGDADVLDLDLNPAGTIDGPVAEGLTVGLAWSSDDKLLYWLENRETRHFLHVTEPGGQILGLPNAVDPPLGLGSAVQLGEMSYDPVAKYFWTVDLLNGLLYGLNRVGAVPDEFDQKQVANPETGGFLSGGIAVVASSAQSVTLDIALGKPAAGFVDQIGRFELAKPGFTRKEVRRFDLAAATGATSFGGIEIVDAGPKGKFEYVVGMDTRTIYKLRLTSETEGLKVFRRGDVNNDGGLNISDPSALLSYLFKGGAQPPCQVSADVDDSGALDIGDAVYLFNYLFKGGPVPAEPFAACGIDLGSPISCGNAVCTDA